MSGKKHNFDKKYNFDLTNEIKPIQNNHLESFEKILYNNSQIEPFQEKKIELKKMIDDLDVPRQDLKVIIQVPSEEEKRKIIIDSKTYSQNLKRKVILNYNLFKLYYQNFYHDEFNLSRKSSYFIIGLPSGVIFLFSTLFANHPLFGITFNISILGSIASFVYFYKADMDRIASDRYSEMGEKIRRIKNELVLYNPLATPILTEDEQNEKNYKV